MKKQSSINACFEFHVQPARKRSRRSSLHAPLDAQRLISHTFARLTETMDNFCRVLLSRHYQLYLDICALQDPFQFYRPTSGPASTLHGLIVEQSDRASMLKPFMPDPCPSHHACNTDLAGRRRLIYLDAWPLGYCL